MKIEISKGNSPLAAFFNAPLTPEGEAELLNLRFADELLALMKEQGVSRIELARRMGIQPSRVTSMLSATNNFTTATMVRAARVLGARLHPPAAPCAKSNHRRGGKL